ncbi:MAG TPA: Gfo/Idh/MocA family oxidoreductase [Candidatus Brocadiia bacterium]|nr:Gfo/Idh/MocA family oxidoreductase [Candidatus Brocadiia bacterium]
MNNDKINPSPVTRRRFLKSAGAAIGFPYVVSASALAAGPTAPGNRLNAACIGVQNMGTTNLMTLLGNPEVRVVAVCDVDKAVRDKAKAKVDAKYSLFNPGGSKACDTYNDFREVLARSDVDFIMCATPDHWHALVGIAAAKAGKDMYIEKPLTLTINEGRVLRDTCRRYGRICQTGSQQRSSIHFRRACELALNGRIGKVHTIKVGLPGGSTCPPQPEMPVPPGFDYDMWLGQAPWAPYTEKRCHYNFRFILDYSGGQITNWGAHHIDIGQWGNGTSLTGPVEVDGRGVFPKDGLWNVVQDFRFECLYANGVRMIVSNKERGGTLFEGSEGWIFVSREELSAKPEGILRSRLRPEEIHLYESNSHWDNFLESVRTRRQPICEVEVGHRSATVCHLGNISMRLGRKVKWNPDEERFVNDPEADKMLYRPMREPWSL